MSVFNSGGNIYHTDGSRVVWSTNTRPALLLPQSRVVLSNLDFTWPHLQTANAYGYNRISNGMGGEAYSAASFITWVPQEWDSGLSLVASIPAICNYFQVDLVFSRIATPSLYFNRTIPTLLPEGVFQTLDGASAVAERIGPLVRIFRFERVGNSIYLRRKQSVINAGPRFPWLSGNDPTFPGSGGQRPGWTWGGTNGDLGHGASLRGTATNSLSNRGQSGMAPVDDNTNYASTWRGTVTITPGYIKA